MKLEPEQIKKIVLSLLLLCALLYGYFAYLLGPLQASVLAANNGIASAGPAITEAKKQISLTADLETKAPKATAFLDAIKNSIPDGEPIAWFPPKMSDFFKSRGIDKCTTHMVSEGPDAMPGFKKIVWVVDVPKVEFIPLGMAISELENTEPLLSVTTVSVDAMREDAQYQHATLTLTTLVKS
jgi:phage tail protein X